MTEFIKTSLCDCVKFGCGENVFVIIPGLSVKSVLLSAAAVENDYRRISEKYTVYLIDRRRDIPQGYDMLTMASDTAKTLDELGLDRVNLFGASQGGMIAQLIAATRPEKVRTLVLGSTCAKVSEGCTETIDRWITLAIAGEKEKLYLDFCSAIYPPVFFEKYKKAIIGLSSTVTDEELDRFVRLGGTISGFDINPYCDKITSPLLILGSSDDNVLGSGAADELAKLYSKNPGREYYVYSSYGHASFDTAPDYKKRILSFLNKYNR